MEKKHIKVGADPFPPYQYGQDDGTLAGIDYSKVIAVFEKAGFTAEVELHDWPIVEQKLNSGEFSAAFQVQPTPERLKQYHFSNLLRNAATEVVTSRRDLELSAYSEIERKGLKLGVIEGYTNGPDIDALSKEAKRTYPSAVALLLAISQGEVDLGVYDRGVKQYLMDKNGITNIYPIEAMTFTRPLHVIFTDAALCAAFNAALES